MVDENKRFKSEWKAIISDDKIKCLILVSKDDHESEFNVQVKASSDIITRRAYDINIFNLDELHFELSQQIIFCNQKWTQ